MKYKDMKEMTLALWDSKPFQAYVTDVANNPREPGHDDIVIIDGYRNGRWLTSGCSWVHVYPVDLNQPKPKRMTNRQLAEWCAKGKGLVRYDSMYVAYSSFTLDLNKENETVDEDISVRLIGSEEWIEPTQALLVPTVKEDAHA